DVEEFAKYGGIPIINALTDEEHPCQILADIFTFTEKRGPIAGKVVTFVGDGTCNVCNSWIFAAAKLGFELRIAAPREYRPPKSLVLRAGAASEPGVKSSGQYDWTVFSFPGGGSVRCTADLKSAISGADMLYTD